MTDISAVGERAIESDFALREPEQETEAPALVATPPTLSHEASLERLRATESLHRALATHHVESPSQQFAQYAEQFRNKLKTFQGDPVVIQEFSHELEQQIDQAMRDIALNTKDHTSNPLERIKEMRQRFHDTFRPIFVGKESHFKTELATLYCHMLRMADTETFDDNYAAIKLFELERETGCVVLGLGLTQSAMGSQWRTLAHLFSKALSSFAKETDLHALRQFCWGPGLTGMKQISDAAEKGGDARQIKQVARMIVRVYYDPAIYDTMYNMQSQHNDIASFIPYVIKYQSLNALKPYFIKQWAHLSPWDRAYHWIGLHCQAAEILASLDPKQSAEHLSEAEKLRDKELWSYPFSFNRSAIASRRKEADLRIAQVMTAKKN